MTKPCIPITETDHACAEYIKSVAGTERIMKGIRQRYVSLSNTGGNFVLIRPTEAEKEFLRGLFKKDYSEARSISISLKKFVEAFNGTRFGGISLSGLLTSYFGETPVTNKALQITKKAEFERYFTDALEYMSHAEVQEWLNSSLSNTRSGAYKWLLGAYQLDKTQLQTVLWHLNELVNRLDRADENSARPVVAAQVTKDPHSLDDDMPLMKALTYFLCHRYGTPWPETASEYGELLERANILTDSVNNSISTYGLKAMNLLGSTLYWEQFHNRREPLTLTSGNLEHVKKLEPTVGCCVWCFENPAVFYTFVQRFPHHSALCSGGQLNRTALKLMTLLAENNISVWYHGDYDPEGLLIADKLKQQFHNVRLFAYTKVLYQKAQSGRTISEKRLKQLEKLQTKELIAIGELIKKVKVAGYQEYIIDDLMGFCTEESPHL